METKMDNTESALKRIEDALTSHINWEAKKYEEMGGKFSGKWVEKVIIALVVSVLAGLIAIV